MASRRVVNLTLDTLDDLPSACRKCVFWELDPVAQQRTAVAGDTALEKEAWISATLLEWGSCGKLAYVDDAPAGYVLFAPPGYVPRAVAFPTSPVSADAVLLMTAYIVPESAGLGLGRMLIQSVARDLLRHGVKALEAFADNEWSKPACILPSSFLLNIGFKTVRPHPRFPRLRLDLRTALSWRSDVEYALEQLLDTMQPPVGAAKPAVAAP